MITQYLETGRKCTSINLTVSKTATDTKAFFFHKTLGSHSAAMATASGLGIGINFQLLSLNYFR